MTTHQDENAALHTPKIEPAGPPPRRVEGGVDGRRFVIASLGVIALAWVVLFAILAPGMWSYQKQAEFGRKEVAPVVFGFLKVQPPGVDSREWDRAIGDAHSLVLAATRAESLGIDAQTALRDDIQAALGRAKEHPEAAVGELAALWDRVAEIARKNRPAGAPEVDRSHPRPSILPAGGRE